MNKLTNLFTAALVTISVNSFAGTCPALNGSFTIGKSENADFTTVQDAANALMCGGVSAPVTFRLENGTYNERVVLSSIAGASSINTITFESKSGEKSDAVISYNSSDATIVLNGTSYVSFENITVQHKDATYGNCLRAEGKASNISFKGVIFDGVEADRSGTGTAVVYFTSTAPKSEISMTDCEVNNGSMGIYKSGMSADVRDSKTIISGNLFFNQFEAGVALSNEDAPEVSNNVVSSMSANTNFKGIYLDNAANQIIVTKNVVNATMGAVGLAMNNCEAQATNAGQINNNSIVANGSGISLTGTTDNQILNFNRVKLSINGGNQTYYANSSTGNNINLMNNIFFDLNTGSYTIIGNTYKDFFNQLPSQSNAALSASANGVMIEKVSAIK